MRDRKKVHTSKQDLEAALAPLQSNLVNLQNALSIVQANIISLSESDINSSNVAASLQASVNSSLLSINKNISDITNLQNNVSTISTDTTANKTAIAALQSTAVDNVAAYVIWTISNNQPVIVKQKNIKGVGFTGAGEFIFTYNTPVASSSPYSIELMASGGAYFAYISQSTMTSITVKIQQLVLLSLGMTGANIPGCLIVFK